MALSRLLRLKRFDRSSDAVRIKAILFATFILLLAKVIGLSYHAYTAGFHPVDTSVFLASTTAVFAIVLSYRYHNKFYIAGLGFTLIMAVTVYLIASIRKVGIHSSLTPYLPLAAIFCGFISGWRATIVSGVICVAVTAALFVQTAMYTGDGTLAMALQNQYFMEKTLQIALSCGMATFIAAMFSLSMHGLFKRDEISIEKIQMAQRQRTAFLSSLSHEIRTPLNGIVGMSGLLQKTELTSQQKQYADIVSDCGENLLEVLGTVMEFSQINNERIVLNPEIFDLHKLAHSLVQKYASRIPGSSDVLLGMHISEKVPHYFEADAKRIELVLNHLLRNAVHFTSQGSINLLINGKPLDNGKFRLCVFVRDTGVGIRQSEIREIYKPFHQLDNRLTREHEGTGLGLSLCKEIIEFMNGKLDVISEFGVGSTFYFEIVLPTVSKDEAVLQGVSQQLAEADDLSNVAVFRRSETEEPTKDRVVLRNRDGV